MTLIFELFVCVLLVFLLYSVFKLQDKNEELQSQLEGKINYSQIFQLYYEIMEQLFDSGLIEPREDFKGYRCDLIASTFFKIYPDAKDMITLNLDDVKINDIYYDPFLINDENNNKH